MQVGGREEVTDKDKDKVKGRRLSSIAVVVPQSSRIGAGARSDKAPKTQFDVCLVDYCADGHDSTAQRKTIATSSGGHHCYHHHHLAARTDRDRKRFRSGYGLNYRRGVRLTVYAWADLLGAEQLCPGRCK
jgi:hypothetical protein